MTATDELRRMLDERGVYYGTEDMETIRYTDWGDWLFSEPLNAKPHTLGAQCELMLAPATTEHAIAATLGAGTCHKLPSSGDTVCIVRMHGLEMEFGYWRCSECGCECFEGARYCMNCGGKVVEE